MEIKTCTLDDVPVLALLNKQLIEDEKSTNSMCLEELEQRMKCFLETDYTAYFFRQDTTVLGYALVNKSRTPLYLRQFFIKREYRNQHYGSIAFELLLEVLNVKELDLEVLPWNKTAIAFWHSCGFHEISRNLRLERK